MKISKVNNSRFITIANLTRHGNQSGMTSCILLLFRISWPRRLNAQCYINTRVVFLFCHHVTAKSRGGSLHEKLIRRDDFHKDPPAVLTTSPYPYASICIFLKRLSAGWMERAKGRVAIYVFARNTRVEWRLWTMHWKDEATERK